MEQLSIEHIDASMSAMREALRGETELLEQADMWCEQLRGPIQHRRGRLLLL